MVLRYKVLEDIEDEIENYTIGIIRKNGNKYCLYSKKSGKKLFCHSSKNRVIQREREIQTFKRLKGKVSDDFLKNEIEIGNNVHDVSINFIQDLFSISQKVDKTETGKYLRIRMESPSVFDEFRIIDIDKDKGVKAVIGITGKGNNKKSKIQSYLFDKKLWTAKEARKWVKDHTKKESKTKAYIVTDAYIVSEDDIDADKLSKAGIQRNKDLLYVRFKLCHVGANSNKDEFTYDELDKSHPTILYKPINWEHNPNEIIGCVYDCQFVDKDKAQSSNPFILCDGVIYKYQFPSKATIVKERFERGNLTFSMEVWFENVECSVCNNVYENTTDYCEHLRSRMSSASKTSRILRGLTFGGAGVVKKPADTDAIGLSVAAHDSNYQEWELDSIDRIIDSFSALEFVIKRFLSKLLEEDIVDKEKVQEKINEIFNKLIIANEINNGDLIMEDTFTKADVDRMIKDAVDEFKSEIDLENKEEEYKSSLSSKEKEIEELKSCLETANSEIDKAKNEFDEFKKSLEKEKILSNRLNILKESGFEMADDKKDAVVAMISKFTDDEFETYKNLLVTSKKDNKKSEKSSDVPNGTSNASASVENDNVSNLETIMGKILNKSEDK